MNVIHKFWQQIDEFLHKHIFLEIENKNKTNYFAGYFKIHFFYNYIIKVSRSTVNVTTGQTNECAKCLCIMCSKSCDRYLVLRWYLLGLTQQGEACEVIYLLHTDMFSNITLKIALRRLQLTRSQVAL